MLSRMCECVQVGAYGRVCGQILFLPICNSIKTAKMFCRIFIQAAAHYVCLWKQDVQVFEHEQNS